MTRRLRGLVAGFAVLLALAFWTGPTRSGDDKDVWKGFIPEESYKELVDRETNLIQQYLKAPDEEKLKRARIGALFIMGLSASHAAPNDGTKGQGEIAQGLRNHLGVESKKPVVLMLMRVLKEPKGMSGTTKRDWRGTLTLREIMDILQVQKKGGDGIASELQVNIRLKGALNGVEEKVRNLAQKKLSEPVLDKASKELSLLSYKLAVLGEITHEYPAPKKKGTPKEWSELSIEMRDAAIELAAASKKKDAEAVHKSANRLNSSCSQCHSLFR
jgi:hypothetical protein